MLRHFPASTGFFLTVLETRGDDGTRLTKWSPTNHGYFIGEWKLVSDLKKHYTWSFHFLHLSLFNITETKRYFIVRLTNRQLIFGPRKSA